MVAPSVSFKPTSSHDNAWMFFWRFHFTLHSMPLWEWLSYTLTVHDCPIVLGFGEGFKPPLVAPAAGHWMRESRWSCHHDLLSVQRAEEGEQTLHVVDFGRAFWIVSLADSPQSTNSHDRMHSLHLRFSMVFLISREPGLCKTVSPAAPKLPITNRRSKLSTTLIAFGRMWTWQVSAESCCWATGSCSEAVLWGAKGHPTV